MTPFTISLRPGLPLSEQIIFAAKRAILSGQMLPGDTFPSVRALSRELRINPNTAHRAISELIHAGLLATVPGIGTVVATPPESSARERTELLGRQMEELVLEARRLGVPQDELLRSVARHYELLTPEAGGTVRR